MRQRRERSLFISAYYEDPTAEQTAAVYMAFGKICVTCPVKHCFI
jgi:hypothetical protein